MKITWSDRANGTRLNRLAEYHLTYIYDINTGECHVVSNYWLLRSCRSVVVIDALCPPMTLPAVNSQVWDFWSTNWFIVSPCMIIRSFFLMRRMNFEISVDDFFRFQTQWSSPARSLFERKELNLHLRHWSWTFRWSWRLTTSVQVISTIIRSEIIGRFIDDLEIQKVSGAKSRLSFGSL